MNSQEYGFTDPDLCRFAVNSIPIALVALDSERKITAFNVWAEKLTGFSAKEAIGGTCADILQTDICGGDCPMAKIARLRRPIVELEATIKNKQGEEIPVRISAAGLFAEDGTLVGGVEALQDISRPKKMERERNTFISMFAHDMRSSVTGIRGLVLRLLNKSADMEPDKRKEHLEIVGREAEKLQSLVEEFLEFARFETKKPKLEFGAVSLDAELAEIHETYRAKAGDKGVDLKLEIEEPLPMIDADVRRLRRLFTNLLDNAVKFTPKGGSITTEAREAEHEVMVKVADKGPGIDPKELPYIFDIFHKGRKSRTGYGIGLAIVRAIVEAHGGRIHLTSEPGKGAVFTVFLPKEREEEPQE